MWEKIRTAIIGVIGYGIVIGCIGIFIYLIWFHTTWMINFINGHKKRSPNSERRDDASYQYNLYVN